MRIQTARNCFFGLALFAGAAAAQEREASESMLARIDRVVAEAMAGSRADGAVVLVNVGGEPFLARAYGSYGKIPVEPNSSFHLGALTENFVACALLRLSQEKKLDLEAPVSQYLPVLDWKENLPKVRDLLTHSSGLSSYADFLQHWHAREPQAGASEGSARAQSSESELDAILAAVRLLDFEAEPGTCFAYDHIHDLLASALLMRVHGTSLSTALQELIFDPLDMENMQWVENGDVDSTGENARQIGGESLLLPHHPDFFGETNLVGRGADLLLWMRAIGERELLEEEHTRLLTTPHVLTSGETIPRGLGLGFSQLDEYKAWVVGGVLAGDCVHLAHYAELDLSVAVLAHDEDFPAARVERRVLRAILDLHEAGVQDWPLTQDELKRYAGTYQIGCNRLEVGLRGEHLEFSFDQEPRARLLYQGSHLFVVGTDPEIRVQFTLEAERATSFVLDDHGTPSVGTRVSD